MSNQRQGVFESDLQLIKYCLLSQLAVGVVYDPQGLMQTNSDGTLVHLRTETELRQVAAKSADLALFALAKVPGDIALDCFGAVVSQESLRIPNKFGDRLFYTTGRYRSIRFAFTDTLKSPLFYRIKDMHYAYPEYKVVLDRAALSLGMGSLVAESCYYLYHSGLSLVDDNPFFIHAEDYVFTKRADVFLVAGNEIRGQVRLSEMPKGLEYLRMEAWALGELRGLSAEGTLRVAQVLETGDTLRLSNNYPKGAEASDQLNDLHLKSLNDMYGQQVRAMRIGDFLEANHYLDTIKAFKLILDENIHPKGLSAKLLETLSIDIIGLMGRFRQQEPVLTSMYHGQFIPHNCLINKDKLHLNNFGQGLANMPLLFDAFFYLFYDTERQAVPGMGYLDDAMKHLFRNKILLGMIREHGIPFKLHLALFHVHHIVNQLERFLKQRFINPNANFTLQFYRQALERMHAVEL
jgi:hypothetical protein